MIGDLGIIFKVYLISLGLQFLVWPWVNIWALGRVMSLLAIGLPIWFLGHVWPVNTDVGIAIVILLLMLVGLSHLGGVKPSHPRGVILVEEGLFILGLFGLSLIRGFQPDILGLEKFMDFGFVKQYLLAEKLPARDMWLAGETINYYSFGHFLTSILVRIWGVGLEAGYNLMLAWILGTSLALSFSIIVKLGGGVVGGVMGALLTCLGGNSHALWYLVKNKGFNGYWYADATRFIENTIHEFPGYSFVVSDLHAHVLGLPMVLAFILVLVGVFNGSHPRGSPQAQHNPGGEILRNTTPGEKSWVGPFLILGILLGAMAMTNTWDAAVYGLLLGVVGLIWLFVIPTKSSSGGISLADESLKKESVGVNCKALRLKGIPRLLPTQGRGFARDDKKRLSSLLELGLVIVMVAVITTAPWWLNFKFFGDGVGLVNGRSPWWQINVLWNGHVLVAIGAIILAWKMNSRVVGAIGVTALVLLLIPEVVYVKDIYTTHQRANTMFKLTYQAFIMMSLLFGWVAGKTSSHLGRVHMHTRRGVILKVGPLMLTGMLFVLWGGLMLFPVQAFSSYYGGFKKYKGLDGLAWLKKDKDKWGMIRYLEENRDGKNLVEAVGDSYTKFNSVSAFSGTPAVLGWRVHEWLWRGGYEVVAEREKKIRDFYETGNKNILEEFDVGWVMVGTEERGEYKVDEKGVLRSGEIVWRGEKNYLVRVRP